MRTFGKRVDGVGGRRPVSAVVLAASALGFSRSSAVIVPDLSPAGAKLQGRDLPSPGERLLINFGETGLFATVAWRRSNECGILFDRRLDERGIQQLECEAGGGRAMGAA
jgi:hypothetical protein